jgi:hypothetical protein
MMIRIIFLLIVVNSFFLNCKKKDLPQIGLELINPKEGLIIQFNGSANRLYFIKANVSSKNAIQKIEYKITNTADQSTISAFLEDDYRGASDVNLDVSEYMPASAAQSINASITLTVTDVTGFTQTKTVNYKLNP